MERVHAVLREPFVHFILLGAALFAISAFWDANAPRRQTIRVSDGQIASLAAGFARTWQRPPDEQELKELVDGYVREEIAVREALAMGLERDDTIIRRRLRQKFEFIAEDAFDLAPPTEAELRAWLENNAAAFERPAEIALRQILLRSRARGPALDGEVAALLEKLQATGSDWQALGRPSLLPGELALSSVGEIGRMFGTQFAAALEPAPVGRWIGPIESGYGFHLVRVEERQPAATPPFAQIADSVLREYEIARRRDQLAAVYGRLLENYRIVFDQRAAADPAATAPPAAQR